MDSSSYALMSFGNDEAWLRGEGAVCFVSDRFVSDRFLHSSLGCVIRACTNLGPREAVSRIYSRTVAKSINQSLNELDVDSK